MRDREDRILLGREKIEDSTDRLWVGGQRKNKNKENGWWRTMKRQ